MKYDGEKVADDAHVVTPFAGVWIEIVKAIFIRMIMGVTPFAGVWIEIGLRIGNRTNGESHSLRGSVD